MLGCEHRARHAGQQQALGVIHREHDRPGEQADEGDRAPARRRAEPPFREAPDEDCRDGAERQRDDQSRPHVPEAEGLAEGPHEDRVQRKEADGRVVEGIEVARIAVGGRSQIPDASQFEIAAVRLPFQRWPNNGWGTSVATSAVPKYRTRERK
jgi:hypothetical protein